MDKTEKIKKLQQYKQDKDFAVFSVLMDLVEELRKEKEIKFNADDLEKLKTDIKVPEVTIKFPDRVSMDIANEHKVIGPPGKTPTTEELLALIKPLIPRVVDGKTPTKQELLALIRPLIPKVADGKTPTTEELLALITPLIPKVENGKDGKDGHIPKHEWKGTLIRFENPDGSWGRWVDLKGSSGDYQHTMRGGGGSTVKEYDLSSLLDGVTKTFTIPQNQRVRFVHSGSFPFSAFQPTVDYTYNSNSITFTDAIDAATTLAAGQVILIDYLEG